MTHDDLIERLWEVGRDGVWKSGRNRATAHPMCIEAADAIERLEADNALLQSQLDAVKRHIPINYLQSHDVPGATGPTAALNLEAAMREYAEDRWKLLDRFVALRETSHD